jgi:hypothetical protein
MKPVQYLFLSLVFVTAVAPAQTDATQTLTDPNTLVPTTITFQTNPTGLSVIVDGVSHKTPYQTSWTRGTTHTINTASPQAQGTDTQYVFSSWSDGGQQSHSVTAPRNAITYTATFATQYYLSMSAAPTEGGTFTPSSGWHNKGQSVSIDATPSGGYSFSSWSGKGSGSYTGTAKSTTITMNGPISETANFGVLTQPILSVTPSDRPVSSGTGATTFSVTNTGTGTMNWNASSDQTWATITGGGSGSNSGTITVSYTENSSTTDTRLATITVTASGATGSPKAVTLTQAPAPPPVLVSDTTSLSDDFNGTALDAATWEAINPLGDAVIAVTNNELTLGVPGGVKHEPWTSGNTAPRVLQATDPSMNVQGWTVKFNSLPAGSSLFYPMQGLFFEQDSMNYLRTDIFSDGTSVFAFAAGFVNGPANPTVYFSVAIPVTNAPVWLHVTRAGNQWRVYYSPDGSSLFTAGTFDHSMTIRRVGVFAGNSGSAPEAYTCLVDYFQGALPAKPYLSVPESGASGVPRPVNFSWNPATGATLYRLQVASDQSLTTLVFDSLVTGTSCTVGVLQPPVEHYWWRVAGKNDIGWGEFSNPSDFGISLTDVTESARPPDRYALNQNYPNPFNPTTVIEYDIMGDTDVRLVVYDMLGREVAVLVDGRRSPGRYRVTFDGSPLSTGIYMYRLSAGSYTQVRKLCLIR